MYFIIDSFALILLSFGAFKLCECHPSGAPVSACDDLLPHHGAQPQISKSPYVLTAQPKNHSIEVTIESSDHTPFRGFAIQARRANATSGAIGKFVAKGQEAHTITCFANPDNTITHSDRSDKHKLTVVWIPPIEHTHQIQVIFVGTVVKTAKEFWTNHESDKISMDFHEHIDGNNIDDHAHHKDPKTGQKTNGSSETVVNHLLISSFLLLILRKI